MFAPKCESWTAWFSSKLQIGRIGPQTESSIEIWTGLQILIGPTKVASGKSCFQDESSSVTCTGRFLFFTRSSKILNVPLSHLSTSKQQEGIRYISVYQSSWHFSDVLRCSHLLHLRHAMIATAKVYRGSSCCFPRGALLEDAPLFHVFHVPHSPLFVPQVSVSCLRCVRCVRSHLRNPSFCSLRHKLMPASSEDAWTGLSADVSAQSWMKPYDVFMCSLFAQSKLPFQHLMIFMCISY